MTGDRVQITPGYGADKVPPEEIDDIVSELWESQRFQHLLEVQRQKPECTDTCVQEYQFEKLLGPFVAEVLACRRCKQIVVNVARSAAA